MKRTNSSLEDFLEKYLKNKSLYEGADSYESYVRKNAKNPRTVYASALPELYSSRARSRGGYGSSAERLAEAGLFGSGYQEHLERTAEREHNERLDALERDMRESEDTLLGGYTAYLDKYKSSQEKLSKSVSDKIVSTGILSEERAYEYAKEAGLSAERARSVAERASRSAKDKLMRRIMLEIPYMQMDGEGARLYALSLGLDSNYAERAREYAESLREHYDTVGASYLEYLASKGNQY